MLNHQKSDYSADRERLTSCIYFANSCFGLLNLVPKEMSSHQLIRTHEAIDERLGKVTLDSIPDLFDHIHQLLYSTVEVVVSCETLVNELIDKYDFYTCNCNGKSQVFCYDCNRDVVVILANLLETLRLNSYMAGMVLYYIERLVSLGFRVSEQIIGYFGDICYRFTFRAMASIQYTLSKGDVARYGGVFEVQTDLWETLRKIFGEERGSRLFIKPNMSSLLFRFLAYLPSPPIQSSPPPVPPHPHPHPSSSSFSVSVPQNQAITDC
ncbi:hypothetical protein H4219_006278 [Mycoemilia scoparia]|uniref:Uncharacterized protein n=1 Tax=Mycoemilia scoparia TaxID=417184 RepID=A0A9W7ZS06_9FUNG|nr:hypothetical protein H4219_006278 [Mycoemilia scoparia]